MSLLIFIAILVALIWVHELGHFSVAKFFRVRVDEFAIGFPPKLLRVRWGETDYTLNLLLVGGFVRIHGENPDDVPDGVRDPRALTSKNRAVQAAVMLAGIAFNIIFAWLMLSVGYMQGLPASPGQSSFGHVVGQEVIITNVRVDSPAEKAGLKPGDSIEKLETAFAEMTLDELSTNRQADAVRNFIGEHQDENIVFSVERGGEMHTLLAKPTEGIVPERKVVGMEFGDVGTLTLPPHTALLQGAVATYDMTIATARDLGSFLSSLVFGRADFSQVAGPIGIAGVGSQAVQEGFTTAVLLTALISINLALINLIPIPGLDGGRLLIIAIEAVIRRPVPARIVNSLMLVGFALVILLMVVVSYHDIARLVE